MKLPSKIVHNLILSGFIALWLVILFQVFVRVEGSRSLLRFMCVSVYTIKCIFCFGLLYFQQLRMPEWKNLYQIKGGILATSLKNVLWLDVFGGLINLKPPPLDSAK